MRIPADTYFKSLQWTSLFALFLFSIFVHRPTALIVFGGLLVWAAYIQWQLPARLFKRLDGGRLNDSKLQASFASKDCRVKTHKTKLHHLDSPWPTVILLQRSNAHVFFGPLLAKKLSAEDLQILKSLVQASFDKSLPQLGLKFYGYTSPLLKTFRWLDRNLKFARFEKVALQWLRLVVLPLQKSWDDAWQVAAEEYSKEDVLRLRRKLSNLIAAHQKPLPSEFVFLGLDMDLAIPQKDSIIPGWPQLQLGKTKKN